MYVPGTSYRFARFNLGSCVYILTLEAPAPRRPGTRLSSVFQIHRNRTPPAPHPRPPQKFEVWALKYRVQDRIQAGSYAKTKAQEPPPTHSPLVAPLIFWSSVVHFFVHFFDVPGRPKRQTEIEWMPSPCTLRPSRLKPYSTQEIGVCIVLRVL